jgi:predicted PurR-regulated permease PerM
MGVEHAATWGLLAGVFHSNGDVTQGLQMAAAALVITSLEGWLLTPALMGKAERMSPLAVFLGLLLFTWVWGGWGTLLAVPMLVVIKSIADYVDRLRPVGRLMAP